MKTKLLVLLLVLMATPTWGAIYQCTNATSTASAAKNRIRLILTNDSDTEICFNLQGGSAILDNFLCLQAGDRAFFDEQTSMPKSDINCIHGGAGNKAVSIEELVR